MHTLYSLFGAPVSKILDVMLNPFPCGKKLVIIFIEGWDIALKVGLSMTDICCFRVTGGILVLKWPIASLSQQRSHFFSGN